MVVMVVTAFVRQTLDGFAYFLTAGLDKSAEEAVSQIVDKNYAMRFSSDSRPVYAVGLNINKDQRSIDDWTINKIEQEAPHHIPRTDPVGRA